MRRKYILPPLAAFVILVTPIAAFASDDFLGGAAAAAVQKQAEQQQKQKAAADQAAAAASAKAAQEALNRKIQQEATAATAAAQAQKREKEYAEAKKTCFAAGKLFSHFNGSPSLLPVTVSSGRGMQWRLDGKGPGYEYGSNLDGSLASYKGVLTPPYSYMEAVYVPGRLALSTEQQRLTFIRCTEDFAYVRILSSELSGEASRALAAALIKESGDPKGLAITVKQTYALLNRAFRIHTEGGGDALNLASKILIDPVFLEETLLAAVAPPGTAKAEDTTKRGKRKKDGAEK